jgi:hypothetical protein
MDKQRVEIHPDMQSAGENITGTIEKQAEQFEKQKEIDDRRIEIKTETKTIVEKFDSEVEKLKKDDEEI